MRLGSIAAGNDFFDRQSECDDLWRYLESDHIVASGPRRLGKSSIVNRLREEAEAKGLLVRHVDVEDAEGAQKFVHQLSGHFPDVSVKGYLGALSDHARKWLSLVKKIDVKGPGGIGGGIELQAGTNQSWHTAAMALQARLTDVPVLIFIDEFSVFLQKLLKQDAKEAEALLAWLRAWRIKPGVACRFLFTGSIGLNALLESCGLSAQFNDCVDYQIGPFKPPAARAMVRTFAQRQGWSIDVATANFLCERVGWLSPFHLCLLLDQTVHAARDRIDEMLPSPPVAPPKELTRDDIDNAYERLVAVRSRFIHWEERLKRDLTTPELPFAYRVLTSLAKNPDGLTLRQLHARLAKQEPNPDVRAQRLQAMLRKLQEEGYTSAPGEGGRVKFLSFLLRDYWGRNHV